MTSQENLIRVRTNLGLGITLSFFNLFFLFLPCLTTQVKWLLCVALINAVLSTPYWSLIHEAIHHIYLPNKKANHLCGRIMAILFGTVFTLAQYGHLMHHRMNRQSLDLIDAYHPKSESFWRKSVQYYLHIFGGLYLFEMISPLLAFLPLKWLDTWLMKFLGTESPYYEMAKKKLLTPKVLSEMRLDAIFLCLMLTAGLVIYGHNAWIFILGFLLRSFFISFADNLPHYRTPVDQPRYAHNTYLPFVLRLFWLNFNLHRIHHANPALPWHKLHQVFLVHHEQYEMAYFKQAIRQLKGVWAMDDHTATRKMDSR